MSLQHTMARMGATAVALAALSLPSAAANVAPSSLAFGGQSMGTTSPGQQVTFTNNTAAPITFVSIVTSAQFTQTTNCPNTVLASASCVITVAFTPTPAGTNLNDTTSVTGTLTITSTDPGSPQVVNLSGTGERSLVTHYYRSILRRAPDTTGKTFWQNEAVRMKNLGANVNETWYAMAMSFFASSEYAALNRDSTGYVTDLYNTFFNRPPDAGGLAYWVGLIDTGLPRDIALVSFMFSTEFTTFTQNIFGNTAARPEIDMVGDFYRGMLARLPDDAGFNSWVQLFRAAQCLGATYVNQQVESISANFMTGSEYLGRNRNNPQFVADMYNSFLRRGGDPSGVGFWINALNSNSMTRNAVRQQFIASTEFQARVTSVINTGCLGKSYVLSPTGSDSNDGSSAKPWKTFAKAWTVLGPSDRLLVSDGTYTNAWPPKSKAGSAGNPITVQAVNPGGAIINGGLAFQGNSYMTFIGFKIPGTSFAVEVQSAGTGKPSHHLTFQQIGFSCTPGTLNDGACFDLGDGTHHVLLEDSWGYGGGRYTILCYGGPGGSPPNLTCDYNTFRRVVLRMGPAQSSGGNPQAALSLYYASNNTVENVIAIDGNAASDTSNSAFYITGHAPPPDADNNKFYGIVALNNLGIGFYLDCSGAVCNAAEVHNSVFWGASQGGIAITGGTGAGDSCSNVIINRNTIGATGGGGIGFENYACSGATLTNNAFYMNTGGGAKQSPSAGSTTVNNHNGYFGNTGSARINLAAGGGDLTVQNPNFAFITRIEAASAYHNAGLASGAPVDIGANVVNRYQDGVLTANALWPWPNEARLRAEMCATPQGSFCNSGKSFTKFIWEYLGNTSPY